VALMKKQYYKMNGNDAVARAYNCPISFKFSVEMAREIKDQPYKKVVKYLEDIMALKRHLPLKRYNKDVGHKKGDAVSGVKSGRFPVKVAKYFLKVLEMAKSNADYIGLDSTKKDLVVRGAVVSQGVKRFNFQTKGKRRVRRDQTTCVEIVLVQQGKFVKKDLKPKEEKKTETKVEAKKEEKIEKKDADKKIIQKEKIEEHKKTLARENQKGSN
jgi:large subunit ribosomal protein L22